MTPSPSPSPAICPDCGKHYDVGDWPYPCAGLGHEPGSFWHGDASIHPSERVTVIRNPQTGEVRVPGRADRPTHPKYLAAGFTERKSLTQHSEIRSLEKSQGLLHSASHYHRSNT